MQTQNNESQRVSNPTQAECARHCPFGSTKSPALHNHIYLVCEIWSANTDTSRFSITTDSKEKNPSRVALKSQAFKTFLASEIYFVHSTSSMPQGSQT